MATVVFFIFFHLYVPLQDKYVHNTDFSISSGDIKVQNLWRGSLKRHYTRNNLSATLNFSGKYLIVVV